MQSIEDKKAYNDVMLKTNILSNSIYLFAHISYLIFFIFTKCDALIYFNIGSVIFYSLLFLLIKARKYTLYADLCCVEIFIYMCTATILVGFKTGLHLCILALCIVAFYNGYFAEKKRGALIPAIWSIGSGIAYIALYFICNNVNPLYELEDWAYKLLFVVHAIIAFGFISFYLAVFARYAIKLEDRIKKESRTDKLTGVANRYDLYNYLDSLENKNEYILSMVDIDDFKKINDLHGHLCGDYMLKEIANILDESSNVFTARYGGEEFIIISKKGDNMEDSYNEIDNIRLKIANNKFLFESRKINATVTIGIAEFKDDMTIDEWIKIADDKLYQGKKNGKNQVIN